MVNSTAQTSSRVPAPSFQTSEETVSAAVVASKIKTEAEFQKLHPKWKEISPVDRTYIELTSLSFQAGSHPMHQAVYSFINSAAGIYCASEKIKENDLGILFEGLDQFLKIIEDASSFNREAVVCKAMELIQSLEKGMQEKSLTSKNPEVWAYLAARQKALPQEAFKTAEELGLIAVMENKEPRKSCISFSTVMKTGLAVGILIGGYYAYTADALAGILSAFKKSNSQALADQFKYSSDVDQALMHDVVSTPGLVSLLRQEKADLWKSASDDGEYCLLRVAASNAGKPGNEFIDDDTIVSLFRSGLETGPQSHQNYMNADHVVYALNHVLSFKRNGILEKLGEADLKRLMERMTPQNRLNVWGAAANNREAAEMLAKAGAYMPLIDEFEQSSTLSASLIERIMKDERIILKLIERNADLHKTGEDNTPLPEEYVRHNPSPQLETYHLMKKKGNWPSDMDVQVVKAALDSEKGHFWNQWL